MTKKPFVVGSIAPQKIEKAMFHVILVARDGETWQALRPVEAFVISKGDILEIPIVQSVPGGAIYDWASVHLCQAEIVRLIRPQETIAELWGTAAVIEYRAKKEAKKVIEKPRISKIGTKFSAKNFTDADFMTAAEKAKTANDFVMFVQSGFHARFFTKTLYDRISGMFGFNKRSQAEFWAKWFLTTESKLAFLEHIVESATGGDAALSMVDVERQIKGWLITEGALNRWKATAGRVMSIQERDTLRQLLIKYGIPEDMKI